MPPIYYINLDRRADRRALIERQLGDLGLSATRISAVAVADISQADLDRHCNPVNAVALSRSQLACAMSHRLCWRNFIQAGGEWALVLEDDVLMSARAPGFLDAFLQSPATEMFDLIQLEASARRRRVLPAAAHVGETGLRPFCSTQWGSAGYLISRRAAERLAESPALFEAPVDQTLFRPYAGPGRDIRMCLADPALFMQIDKREASALARGNLTPVVDTRVRPFPARLQRTWGRLSAFVSSVRFHIKHLPMGVTSEVIAFDAPGQRYVGSKLEGYGTEIVD